ncbi:putative membrane protein [Rhodococcus opacus]|uniref:Putative membrane protein n=1 Tax=Rhodococcus opacus TaxID=37919 RepID=A0A1B1K1D0_RHOOP|nr:hypothetical protein [Rhodococcus opacus]ANS26416.1 putative membrane protein [Rhodococcus opacus]
MHDRKVRGIALNLCAGVALVVGALGVGALAPEHGATILAAFAALVVAAFAYSKPDAALISWLVVVAVVPFWTTTYVGGIGLPPGSTFGLPVLAGIAAAKVSKLERTRVTWMDLSIIGASLLIAYLWIGGQLNGFAFVRDVVFVWLVAYVLGRCATPRVMSGYAIIMSAVAAWGLIEFFFGMHLFIDWLPSANQTFYLIQERAGVARSEAAFGHAIAYGAALVMAIPFAQRLPRHAVLVQLLLVGGVAVSLSRGPLLALALTLTLTTWVLADSRLRVRYTLLTLIGGGAAYVIVTDLYSGVYSDEVAGSGNARLDQYFAVRDHLNWLTSSLSFSGPDGAPVVGGIQIIDSTPLRLAVNFGIITALLLLIPVLIAMFRVLSRKAGTASVALAGQIPVLLVTSLITQWQALIFFAMGMVVTEVINGKALNSTADQDGSLTPLRAPIPSARR